MPAEADVGFAYRAEEREQRGAPRGRHGFLGPAKPCSTSWSTNPVVKTGRAPWRAARSCTHIRPPGWPSPAKSRDHTDVSTSNSQLAITFGIVVVAGSTRLPKSSATWRCFRRGDELCRARVTGAFLLWAHRSDTEGVIEARAYREARFVAMCDSW